MFYEFSIQYDDPVMLVLDKTPLSDILYFRVNHAYPNWIPPHYLRMVSEDSSRNIPDGKRIPSKTTSAPTVVVPNSLLAFPFFGKATALDGETDSKGATSSNDDLTLKYHRFVHLAHSFLSSYLPSDVITSPQDSVTASAIKILSPLVPQGNWTTGANPPAPNEFFYRHFPKVSPDFDNDYHTRNPGVFWGWFYLTRWLPDLIQKVLFPLSDVVYDSRINEQMAAKGAAGIDESLKEKASQYIPKARKLTGRQTPTPLECQLCSQFQGIMLWNRQHEWFCVYKNKFHELLSSEDSSKVAELTDADINDEKFRRDHVPKDKDGRRYFTSFNDFIEWNTAYTKRLIDLEKSAHGAKNMDEMTAIEAQIYELKNLRKRHDKITSDNIVSVKG